MSHTDSRASTILPPQSAPPGVLTRQLKRNEPLLIWSPCLLNYGQGILGITSKRVLFVNEIGALLANHPIAGPRIAKVGASITTPQGLSGDRTVVITFADERLDLHDLNPEIANAVAETISASAAAKPTAPPRTKPAPAEPGTSASPKSPPVGHSEPATGTGAATRAQGTTPTSSKRPALLTLSAVTAVLFVVGISLLPSGHAYHPACGDPVALPVLCSRAFLITVANAAGGQVAKDVTAHDFPADLSAAHPRAVEPVAEACRYSAYSPGIGADAFYTCWVIVHDRFRHLARGFEDFVDCRFAGRLQSVNPRNCMYGDPTDPQSAVQDKELPVSTAAGAIRTAKLNPSRRFPLPNG